MASCIAGTTSFGMRGAKPVKCSPRQAITFDKALSTNIPEVPSPVYAASDLLGLWRVLYRGCLFS